jgi:hypothetical protein
MSDQPQSYAFPQRAPVFTAFVVIVGILLFGVFVNRFYHSAAPVDPRGNTNPADIAEDQRWKYTEPGRAAALSKLRQDVSLGNTYGWVDQKAGIARLPIDRAVELIVRDHAKK